MTQTNALMGLLAQTSIHAGTGQLTGIVDLPIQREGHNGWPCVYGSAVKGALRAAATARLRQQKPLISAIFGPDPDAEQGSEYAGALAVGDARLLLLPVRSLTSHFKWVTCPKALERLKSDSERLGVSLGDFEIPKVDKDENALVAEQCEVDTLFLEEYRFSCQKTDISPLINVLAQLMGHDSATSQLTMQLVVVSNDSFTALCEFATPVNAHIRIAAETKTVHGGALWYEETLPPETLLYVALNARSARMQGATQNAEKILDGITDTLFGEYPYLQLGGNETVGMGWCKLSFHLKG